jgi:hypothetical protein
MHIKTIIKITVGLQLSLWLAACATGGNQGAMNAFGKATPICVSAQDCQVKMHAARTWVARNTDLELAVDSEDRLETYGWGMGAYTAVRVERAPIGGSSYWIRMEVNCGVDTVNSRANVCSDTSAALADFNSAVSSASL